MLNLCQFIGNLGKDPEIRNMNNGDKVATLSIGVSETWKDKQSGERKSKTEWVKCVIFNQHLIMVAENYLKKGSKVYISGQMQTRKWTDQSGVDKYSTEICLQKFKGELTMLDSRNNQSDDKPPSPAAISSSDFEDEIPF